MNDERILFNDFHEMRDLGDHAASFRRIGPLRSLVHLAEAEGLERFAHGARAADSAADLLHVKGLLSRLLRAHDCVASPSSPLRPRRLLYSSSLRSCFSASNVAFTTLCGFAVPNDFVRMFWMPADSMIARTGSPAMTPVSSVAGFSITFSTHS